MKENREEQEGDLEGGERKIGEQELKEKGARQWALRKGT